MLFFSSGIDVWVTCVRVSSFNLVIEMLFFSSYDRRGYRQISLSGFNLVIEMLFFSRVRNELGTVKETTTFQSRNRDAFLFKSVQRLRVRSVRYRFNLVIEMLFFSRATICVPGTASSNMFQSRNRDAFLFKGQTGRQSSIGGYIPFQSRNRDAFLFKLWKMALILTQLWCFNLVIEMLFFSRFIKWDFTDSPYFVSIS